MEPYTFTTAKQAPLISLEDGRITLMKGIIDASEIASIIDYYKDFPVVFRWMTIENCGKNDKPVVSVDQKKKTGLIGCYGMVFLSGTIEESEAGAKRSEKAEKEKRDAFGIKVRKMSLVEIWDFINENYIGTSDPCCGFEYETVIQEMEQRLEPLRIMDIHRKAIQNEEK